LDSLDFQVSLDYDFPKLAASTHYAKQMISIFQQTIISTQTRNQIKLMVILIMIKS